jgi:hypothetical protein
VPARRSNEPLPPALPPAERTVGQLVAETIRFYGSHFWRSLALGIGAAAAGVGLAFFPGWWRLVFVLTVGALLLTGSYVAAVVLVHGLRPRLRELVVAIGAGYAVFLPAPFLYSLFVLPAVAWLALFGLVVPAVLVEGAGVRSGFRRAFALARADFVHAVGSLATLVITGILTSTVLFFLLREQGEAARWASAFLSLLVISPILFVGAAFLYLDQAARELGSRHPTKRRSRHADLPADDHPHRPGRTDTKGKPRPATRGKPRR